MGLKQETLFLIESLKNKNTDEFWDLELSSSIKIEKYCNHLSSEYTSKGLSFVEIDIVRLARHFQYAGEESYYINGTLNMTIILSIIE